MGARRTAGRRERRRTPRAGALLLVAWAAWAVATGGCHQALGLFSDPGLGSVHESPPVESIAGLWRAPGRSIDALQRAGFIRTFSAVDHWFRLWKDGSCQYHTFVQFGYEEKIHDVLVGEEVPCRWWISQDGHGAGRGAVTVVIELGSSASTATVPFSIAKLDGRLVLWDFAGDPDHRNYMEFERAAP